MRTALFLSVFLYSFVVLITAQAQDRDAEFRASLERLLDSKTVSAETQRMALPYLRARHLVETALGDHRRKNEKHAPFALIEAVRLLRAVECSRHVADYIGVVTASGFGRSPLARYPAAQTLVEFGSAAFPGIFDRLGHDASDMELRLFVLVFVKVDGRRLATLRLEQALEEHIRSKGFQGEEHPRTKNLRRIVEIIRTEDVENQESGLSD